MLEVVDLLLSWVVTTAACFYVVMRDERGLAASGRRERPGHDGVLLAVGQPIVWGGLTYFLLAIRSVSQDEVTAAPAFQATWLIASIATALLTTAAAFFVARRDAQRVTPELLERAWPTASRVAAIVAFSQIAVCVHFWKTRRYGVRGFLLGLFWMAALILPELAIGFVLDLIFPESK